MCYPIWVNKEQSPRGLGLNSFKGPGEEDDPPKIP